MRLSLHQRSKLSKRYQVIRWRRGVKSKAKIRYARIGYVWAGLDRQISIKCPFAINITSKNNRRFTLKFFNDFRHAVIDRNLPAVIDLSELKYILPTAAILLIAEFDRARRLMGEDFRVTLIRSKTHRINAVLDQIGFSGICGEKLSDEEVDEAPDELVRHWRYATGERINDQTTQAFVDIQGRITSSLAGGMWVGISEAIGNSCIHAYLQARGTDARELENKRWWMLSIEREGMLSVTVADLGIGIPRSLPLKWSQNVLSRTFEKLIGDGEDARSIRAALQVGATSTGQEHRGNGLPQIWQDMRSGNKGSISIFSNRGMLNWVGQSNTERSQEFKDSIYGTVITWTLPVEETSHD